MPHSATSKIAAEHPVMSGTETVTSQTNALTSEVQTEALHKAFHNLREAINEPDSSVETIVEEYDKFAANYDKTLVVGALHKKELAVDELVSLLKNNKDALILDLAAGTGIIGQYLCNRGYKNLVALEPSQGMVNEAKKKNIYKEFILEIMNAEPTSIKEETFDAVIAVGALSWNHVSDNAFSEILRITKKGGYIVFLNPTQCVDPFEPSIDRLVQEGAWRMVNRKLVPDYLKGIEGILHTFQKSL